MENRLCFFICNTYPVFCQDQQQDRQPVSLRTHSSAGEGDSAGPGCGTVRAKSEAEPPLHVTGRSLVTGRKRA